jgi:hypothetical protein
MPALEGDLPAEEFSGRAAHIATPCESIFGQATPRKALTKALVGFFHALSAGVFHALSADAQRVAREPPPRQLIVDRAADDQHRGGLERGMVKAVGGVLDRPEDHAVRGHEVQQPQEAELHRAIVRPLRAYPLAPSDRARCQARSAKLQQVPAPRTAIVSALHRVRMRFRRVPVNSKWSPLTFDHHFAAWAGAHNARMMHDRVPSEDRQIAVARVLDNGVAVVFQNRRHERVGNAESALGENPPVAIRKRAWRGQFDQRSRVLIRVRQEPLLHHVEKISPLLLRLECQLLPRWHNRYGIVVK